MTAAKVVHFIGIGGIGISAIAKMFLTEGKLVSGSDRSESPITKELAAHGAKIFYGHAAENVPAGCDLVIYTIAVDPNNPELCEAKRRTIKTITYPEALGELTKQKKTIAIAGTHGKTTTTAMIAKILMAAELDPTVIVGSLMVDSSASRRTNFIAGRGEYLVVEACEYRRSFLNLSPKLAVITNIDNDHLDYYKDLADIQSAFAEFVSKLPQDGVLVCDPADERLKPVTSKLMDIGCPLIDYTKERVEVPLKVPGAHNVKNAQAALAVARAIGIPPEVAQKALEEFTGTWRRFEQRGKTKEGALIYDDYAHHPSEIRATLAGARAAFPKHQIIAIFQPHLYSRTKLLLNDFAQSFSGVAQVILLPIYAAREPFDPSISSEVLAEAIQKQGVPARAVPDFAAAREFLYSLNPNPSTLVITLGAGNIFELAATLVQSGYDEFRSQKLE